MNKVILIGNLTRDPELTTTSGGVALCKFAIAVSRSYTNSNGEREADFFNVVCWRGLAENVAKYLTKGKKVGICGSIQTRTYDAQDGTRRYAIDIAADDVEFLSPGPNTQGNGGYSAAPSGAGAKSDELVPVSDDELPF
ncbi:MAG: single-stranded DNA-binding protein [Firmicutes bacterium]|nr:single-stranded DNA-binding protein [Bacillota bacterium]